MIGPILGEGGLTIGVILTSASNLTAPDRRQNSG